MTTTTVLFRNIPGSVFTWIVAVFYVLVLTFLGIAVPKCVLMLREWGVVLKGPAGAFAFVHWSWTALIGVCLAGLLLWKDRFLTRKKAGWVNFISLMLLVIIIYGSAYMCYRAMVNAITTGT